MRTIPELLRVMLDEPCLLDYGIGMWAYVYCKNDLIAREESVMLNKYLQDNEPPNWNDPLLYATTQRQLQPRLDWINEQLKKFEE